VNKKERGKARESKKEKERARERTRERVCDCGMGAAVERGGAVGKRDRKNW